MSEVRAERGTLTPPVGERDHVTGPATAPVTLVEYGDFECASCRKACLDADRVTDALQAGTYRARVNDDVLSGLKSGVNGTPTFFINGGRYDGPHGTEPLFEALQVASQS